MFILFECLVQYKEADPCHTTPNGALIAYFGRDCYCLCKSCSNISYLFAIFNILQATRPEIVAHLVFIYSFSECSSMPVCYLFQSCQELLTEIGTVQNLFFAEIAVVIFVFVHILHFFPSSMIF